MVLGIWVQGWDTGKNEGTFIAETRRRQVKKPEWAEASRLPDGAEDL